MLIQRLPDESLTAALAAGGREHFGWGRDRHMLADLYDAINTNTRMTGFFETPPDIPLYERPGGESKKPNEPPKPKSVRELFGQFKSGKN